ncbi:hypothetical protein NSE_0155 [Neorickettsia sennetsu str. Miyayama]|uniref:Uncharacterized protein n=1 Tax=Ehrlichia sennetsu (strain ATCC VR-367 / Miyayama) TaxID=222891 RepID=Q2GEP3_EHRS3|nr:hypothetical protein NSE_0155 [Neorickettsia sennetsu str. Miyayama]
MLVYTDFLGIVLCRCGAYECVKKDFCFPRGSDCRARLAQDFLEILCGKG